MNDEQFSKIKLNRTLYSAKRIGSGEPEYFLDYKITTVRYLPTDEHYDIVREMFEICDNDPDNVVNWYNEKLCFWQVVPKEMIYKYEQPVLVDEIKSA